MSDEMARRFIDALGALESQRAVEPLVTLFAERADIGNVLSPEAYHGPGGARDFWTRYRARFGDLRSTFRNVIVGDGRIALEWSTTGTSAGGAPIAYDGVTILELEGDRISRFRAYFDPQTLGREIQGGQRRRA